MVANRIVPLAEEMLPASKGPENTSKAVVQLAHLQAPALAPSTSQPQPRLHLDLLILPSLSTMLYKAQRRATLVGAQPYQLGPGCCICLRHIKRCWDQEM